MIETTKEGTKILATVDGIVRTVFESSLRRNLKLRDEEGISSLPDVELFENLTLMTVPLFAAMLVHQGEGSGTPTEPHQTPSPKVQTPSHTTHPSSSLPPITTTSIPTVTPTKTTPIRQYTRRTRIARSSVPLTVADEPASPQIDVSQGEACPTDSDFIADQDRATIDKSSTLPHNSAPWVISPTTVEGTHEVEINRLKERVKQLEEREGVAATNSRDDVAIKGMNMDEGEVAIERVSDDTKEMVTVLTLMDAATDLASGVIDVPTGSGSILTASTPAEGSVPTRSEKVPTASPVFATATVVTPVIKRKGKEVMVESETPKKQKVQEQIDAQVARELEEQLFSSELPMERRIELISDLVKYQDNYTKIYKFQSQQRKSWTKKQKRDYYMAVIRNNLGWKVKDFRGMTFEEVEAKFNSICKQMEDFIPIGSKEEAEKIKRKAKDKEIFMLVEKDYPLRKGLALVMICYKLQVENFSQMEK
uniref:Uncharacterized protein n=1 Tax=Tanacetum cinerariifolium TaxID=118510 RepID=A0A6L2JMW4_TANCI|nr:hypothetical protein [Tanacetum cinerariifolium]